MERIKNMQYLIEKGEVLTIDKMVKIIQNWQTRELPKLKKWLNYYQGKHKIIYKEATDSGKPCNKIVTNYCKNIVDNYSGYLTGKEITYNSNDDIQSILNVLNYNDVKSEDTLFLRDALIFGKAFEINYVDGIGQQRFKVLPATQCIPIYSNDLTNDLLYVIRLWQENEYDTVDARWYIEVYTPSAIFRYLSDSGFNTFTLISEEPHFFKQCPITVFELPDHESIFNQIISLQDAYNNLLSSEVDDFEGFADAYLVLKGMDATAEDLANMKSKRVLLMDPDASAEYLTKNISDTQITNMLQNINDQIYKKSNCPDFSDEKFGTASGIALRYRLLGFENTAATIESEMKKALQRRIELICAIEKITTGIDTWRDINIQFNRNLPIDLEQVANMVNQLRGLVSNKTLLGQIPFVDNVEEELKQIEEEKQANMELYNFGGGNENDMVESSSNESD